MHLVNLHLLAELCPIFFRCPLLQGKPQRPIFLINLTAYNNLLQADYLQGVGTKPAIKRQLADSVFLDPETKVRVGDALVFDEGLGVQESDLTEHFDGGDFDSELVSGADGASELGVHFG